MDDVAHSALIRARTHMLFDNPFFGTLAMRLGLIEDLTIPTLNVDGHDIRYNPKFVNELQAQDTAYVKSAIGHEVMHCVLDHCGEGSRMAGRDPRKWNWAADYAANSILKEAGFVLHKDWLYDAQYKDMSAEQIYRLLPDPPKDSPQDSVKPGGTNAAQGAEWKAATIQAAHMAKEAGLLPQSMDKFIEALKKSKVDWQAELRHFITRTASGDYSWTRPNRMLQAMGIILPGLYSEEMGEVIFAVDESGSVNEHITAAFAAEVLAVQQDLRPDKLVLMHFDTKVQKTEEFGPDDPFKMVRYCQGGTDFQPIFTEIDKRGQPPACLIVLTDLYGPFPKHAPDYPVLWVSVNNQVAPFGATIPIEV